MARPLTSADLPERFARFAEAEVAAGHFSSVEDVVEAGLEMLQQRQEGHAAAADESGSREVVGQAVSNREPARNPESATPPREPFWRSFTKQVHGLPDAVFERLPKDGASEHDHYLYGAPKSRA